MKKQITEWKDGKNYLSHLMKQKIADPTYLRDIVEDLIVTKSKLKECNDRGKLVCSILSEKSQDGLQKNKTNF